MRSSYIGKAALPVLLLSVSALAGCAIPLKPPPQISYDDDAQPAVQLADPPKPVEVVEITKAVAASRPAQAAAWRAFEAGARRPPQTRRKSQCRGPRPADP